MWPFTKRSASNPSYQDLLAVMSRHIRELKTRCDDLEEELHALKRSHQKLSGRFYGDLGAARSTTAASGSPSKAELRKQLGIVPGRPVPIIRKEE